MNDADHQMALLLQNQFDMEMSIEKPKNNLIYEDKKKKKYQNKDSSKCLIDPSWELVDPTPNIHVLFVAFNQRFFWNKLFTVTVSWSKRMTTCAGVCTYEPRARDCKITLSEPLLKLRPRKDLVETLLHEMIHAFLFVTNNDRDRDGHGPEFHKHMYRINSEAGTNISVYHDFHDEVRLYQQHWWRCNGPCQKRRPFYGFVRRAMNRAPGPYDRWWSEHQATCGGTFIKVKEPEKNTKTKEKNGDKGKNKENKNKTAGDITKFISVTKNGDKINVSKQGDNIKTINNIKNTSGFGTKNMNGTVVLNPKTAKNIPPTTTCKKPVKNNIFTINDIDNNNVKINKTPVKNSQGTSIADYSVVRNKWLNKYDNTNEVKRKNVGDNSSGFKKIKTETAIMMGLNCVSCPVCSKRLPKSEINNHLDTCLGEDNTTLKSDKVVQCPSCDIFMDENKLNDHLDICLNKPTTSQNRPIFQNAPVSQNIPTTSHNKRTSENLVQCEICEIFINSEDHTKHIDVCLNKYYDEIEKKYNLNTKCETTTCLVCNKDIKKTELDAHLETCNGSAFDGSIVEEIEDDDDGEFKNEETEYNCPICTASVVGKDMNKHIDECLTKHNFDFSDEF